MTVLELIIAVLAGVVASFAYELMRGMKRWRLALDRAFFTSLGAICLWVWTALDITPNLPLSVGLCAVAIVVTQVTFMLLVPSTKRSWAWTKLATYFMLLGLLISTVIILAGSFAR